MKILMKAVAGSHLFGTNTPESDMDYKGIYIPSKKDFLLSKVESTLNIKRDKEVGAKNTKHDVDVELFTLQKFIQMKNKNYKQKMSEARLCPLQFYKNRSVSVPEKLNFGQTC